MNTVGEKHQQRREYHKDIDKVVIQFTNTVDFGAIVGVFHQQFLYNLATHHKQPELMF
ncbi:hypothetical protein [Gelidibacter salicanalis]|uniref:Uncharacterized protein n=1 Tax=Gelidibacter salicanalis TaxID=291193 RepID=A0A934KQ15_9FLAO|nr:hypothetical protein [Gelidibacter salicanalis]MBJ7880025.1 hypothetical protein [Gelidibacter salicanalis]